MGHEEILIKIPMHNFWDFVAKEVEKKTGKQHKNALYIRNVFNGTASNQTVDAILDGCVEKVKTRLFHKGMCPARPISERRGLVTIKKNSMQVGNVSPKR